MNKLFYAVIAMAILLVFSLVILRVAYMSHKSEQTTGHMYVISVDDRNNQSGNVSDSIVSQTERCITFRNEFGALETECGDRISIVQVK